MTEKKSTATIRVSEKSNSAVRPPVVVVLGHIDHGKSTLLDYIRKANTTEQEAGGITQHIAAYEIETEAGRRITFIDTPGHAAFTAAREHGTAVADIGILVVSAEDGVKAQTLEALAAIKESDIPYVVAINKVDRESADVERTISSLIENEIYLEGRGGDIPFAPVSAQTGQGVPDLLELVLLVADVAELTAEPTAPAEGVVIEAHRDEKRGIAGTLIITNGTLSSGQYVAAGSASAPVRIMETTGGKSVKSATFSSPVQIVGWNELPPVGSPFCSFAKRKEAEAHCKGIAEVPATSPAAVPATEEEKVAVIPLVVKGDVAGSVEAVLGELKKAETDRVKLRVIKHDVGTITESDVKAAGSNEDAVIVGFNVKVEPAAQERAERDGILLQTFDIIYELTDWLGDIIEKRTPREKVEEVAGRAKILKFFSQTKNKRVVGGEVEEGVLTKGSEVRIVRRGEVLDTGTVLELQVNRQTVDSVSEGNQFGANISSPVEIAPKDVLEAVRMVEK